MKSRFLELNTKKVKNIWITQDRVILLYIYICSQVELTRNPKLMEPVVFLRILSSAYVCE